MVCDSAMTAVPLAAASASYPNNNPFITIRLSVIVLWLKLVMVDKETQNVFRFMAHMFQL